MAGGWIEDFAPFAALEGPTRAELASLPTLQAPRGKILFTPGLSCPGFVVLLRGVVRVEVAAANGRRLLLYRVSPGETCVQTTLCLMGGLDYSAEGVAETDLGFVVAPPPLFSRLLRQSPDFAHFVFERFGARLTEMTRLIERIAFLRIDARLAAAVLARAGAADRITTTHQALAEDIGAAREVVSRQLSAFQRAGLLRLARGEIAICDREALSNLICVT